MTIQTSDAGLMHFAAQKSAEFIIFLPDLAICIKEVSVVHDRQVVMVEERLARAEIAGELGAPGMTGSAHVHSLSRSQFEKGGII